MEDLAKLIVNYGTSTIIICLFIWDWITNKKKIADTLESNTKIQEQNTKILEEMKVTNCNTSKSLELLQESMNTQKDIVIEVKDKVNEINYKLERK